MNLEHSGGGGQRREQILHAAFTCFSRRGFHLSTMHDISAEAGISVGLIYRYFQSKDAVIAALADDYRADIQGALDLSRQAPNLHDAIDTFFHAPCRYGPSGSETAIILDLFGEAARNPTIATLLRELYGLVLDGLERLVADAEESRAGRVAMPPRQVAEILLALYHGGLVHSAVCAPPAGGDVAGGFFRENLRPLWRLLFDRGNPRASGARTGQRNPHD